MPTSVGGLLLILLIFEGALYFWLHQMIPLPSAVFDERSVPLQASSMTLQMHLCGVQLICCLQFVTGLLINGLPGVRSLDLCVSPLCYDS